MYTYWYICRSFLAVHLARRKAVSIDVCRPPDPAEHEQKTILLYTHACMDHAHSRTSRAADSGF